MQQRRKRYTEPGLFFSIYNPRKSEADDIFYGRKILSGSAPYHHTTTDMLGCSTMGFTLDLKDGSPFQNVLFKMFFFSPSLVKNIFWGLCDVWVWGGGGGSVAQDTPSFTLFFICWIDPITSFHLILHLLDVSTDEKQEMSPNRMVFPLRVTWGWHDKASCRFWLTRLSPISFCCSLTLWANSWGRVGTR